MENSAVMVMMPGQQIAHVQAHVDKARCQTRQRAAGSRCQKRQIGIAAVCQKNGRDGSSQREAAVDREVRKIKNLIGNVDTVGQEGVNTALRYGADQQIQHNDLLLL
jgi:hypothetical protein